MKTVCEVLFKQPGPTDLFEQAILTAMLKLCQNRIEPLKVKVRF